MLDSTESLKSTYFCAFGGCSSSLFPFMMPCHSSVCRALSVKMNGTLGNGFNSSTSPEDHIRQILNTTMASVNLALGLPINSYVLWLILSGAGGTIASQFFSLNLIVSGIISLLFSVFFFASMLPNTVIP